MGTTLFSIDRITKYAVWEAFEAASEALFDDRLYAIRKSLSNSWEAMYMPETPAEEQIGEGSTRTELASDIAGHINARRYEGKLVEVATPIARVARIVADLYALEVTGLSMDGAGQIAYAMADLEPLSLILGALLESRLADTQKVKLESESNIVPCDNACGAWGEKQSWGGYLCERCRESGE